MSLRKLPIPYLHAILASIALGALVGLRNYLYMMYFNEQKEFRWGPGLFIHIVNYLTWALLLPLVYSAFARIQARQGASNMVLFLRIVGSGTLLALLHELISNIIYFGPQLISGVERDTYNSLRRMIGLLPAAVITRLIEFGIIYAVISALDLQRKYRNKQVELAKLEGQLSSAQLNALRLQLQPHFLFNTLNTISSLMDFDKKKAQKIVSQLGSLLRSVLDQDKRNLIPLREELDFIKNYLNIEQVRFLDRLTISYRIDEEALDARVPSLLLQPLVENAIKHGFAKRTDEGTIELVCRKLEGGLVQMIVRDDGEGTEMPPEALLLEGIGLKNVKERLGLIYQDDYTFLLKSGKEKGFEAIIIIPFQK